MSRARETSYLHKRLACWARDPAAWGTILAMDLMKNWDHHNLMPESLVEDESLVFGLDCLYASDHQHGSEFCQRAIAVADRIISENKCRASELSEAGYPENLAVVLRGRAYSLWLLGEPLDRADMRQVAEHLTTWCLTKALDHTRFHDSVTMCTYLQGVRAAMVACDLDHAAELLRTKHKLRWHHGMERDLWERLIQAYPDVSDDLKEEFGTFFDRVRDPDFEDRIEGGPPTFINREMLALETGIIRQMYVINDSAVDAVDPTTVIRAVAR
ncbi:MAG: hypothetical protein GY842_11530 [bacterium]|nr:hypothetical protein [bacterium]